MGPLPIANAIVDSSRLSDSVCTIRPRRLTVIVVVAPSTTLTTMSTVSTRLSLPPTGSASAPRLITGCGLPTTIGRSEMRTVNSPSGRTRISTGRPATMIGDDWPRMIAGASTAPTPPAASFVSASRLDTFMGAHVTRKHESV